MSDGADGRFDPRFDPAFQRGFEGGSARAAGSAGRRAASPAPAGSGPVPMAERVAQPIADEPRPPAPAGVDGARRAVVRPEDVLLEVGIEPEPERVRPAVGWLVAIGIVGAGFIAAGFALLAWLREQFTLQGSTGLDYGSFQAASIGAPLAIALGCATLVALLFALAYRRR